MDTPTVPTEEVVDLGPFRKMVMTIGTLPTAFTESMTYYEALAYFMSYIENTVIPAINQNGEATKELQDLFTELHDYVEHYFDDLNVQQEINNKLDAMVEDGTMAEIINQEIFGELNEQIAANTEAIGVNAEAIAANAEAIEDLNTDYSISVHYPTTDGLSGSRQAAKLKDFTVVFDLGIKDYINNFIGYLVNNGMTTIKYVVISHFDTDHVAGDLNGFRSFVENVNLDFTGCKFVFPHTPDWTRMSLDHPGQQERYEAIRDYLLGNNYEIIYPQTEGETLELDGGNTLQFFNCSDSIFEPYYSIEHSANITEYNNFSLVAKLIAPGDKTFVFPGDIYEAAQQSIAEELGSYDVLAIPHHGVNPTAGERFLQLFNAKIGVVMNGGQVTNYQNPLINQFADYDRNLYSSLQSGNVVIYSKDLGVNSQYGSLYPKMTNVITALDDLNDFIHEGVYHYRSNSGAPANSIPGYTSQFRLDVKEVANGYCEQILTGIRTVNDRWYRKVHSTGATRWICLANVDVAYCNLKNNGTFSSNWTTLKLGTETSSVGYTTRFSIDTTNNRIVAEAGIGRCEMFAQLNIGSVQAGDRLTVKVVRTPASGSDDIISWADVICAGSYINIPLFTTVAINEGDKFTIQIRNLTGDRGQLTNESIAYEKIYFRRANIA